MPGKLGSLGTCSPPQQDTKMLPGYGHPHSILLHCPETVRYHNIISACYRNIFEVLENQPNDITVPENILRAKMKKRNIR
jgi:hypothetical protein